MLIKLFVFILWLLISCCAPKQKAPPAKVAPPPKVVVIPEPNAIAMILPLTGENGHLGNAMLDAGFLALHEAKSDLAVMVIDSTLEKDLLSKKIQALKDSGIKIIVGPLFAEDTRSVVSALENQTVLSLSNDSSLADLPGVYLLGYLPEAYVEKIVHEAVIKDIHNFYTLLPTGRYSDIIKNNLVSLSDKYAMELVDSEFYEESEYRNGAVNIRKKIGTNAKKKKAILIAENEQNLDKITDYLNPGYLARNNIQLISLYNISNENMHDGSLDGAWFVGEKKATSKTLNKLLKKVPYYYSSKFITLAYEAVSLAILMKSQHQIIPHERIKGINGTGEFSFDHRRIIQRELVLYRINKNVPELIEQE